MEEVAAIELRSVRKRFGAREVLRGFDLAVPRGVLYGLIGLNGAGKTTSLRVALGFLAADAGDVRVLGVRSRELHTIAGRVGATLHLAGLDPRLTARENLRLHALLHDRRDVDVDGMLDRLGLDHLRGRRVGGVSQGERQRVALARALLLRPDVLLLDEPLTHLDPGAVDHVLTVLREEVDQRGASVLLSSHQLEHVERSSDRLALIHGGQVLMDGTMEELLAAAGRRIWVVAGPEERACAVIRGFDGVTDVTIRSRRDVEVDLLVDANGLDAAALNAALHREGVRVSALAPEQQSLDRVFRDAVRGADAAARESA